MPLEDEPPIEALLHLGDLAAQLLAQGRVVDLRDEGLDARHVALRMTELETGAVRCARPRFKLVGRAARMAEKGRLRWTSRGARRTLVRGPRRGRERRGHDRSRATRRARALIIERAELVAEVFFRLDASARPGGYDEYIVASRKVDDRIVKEDIDALNRTMRARSPVWAWAG